MSILTTLSDVDAAATRIRGVVARTPLVDVSVPARRRLLLKCENLQVAGAFKIRGAFNFILQIHAAERARGVITYSSGNHAQAVAYAARALGAPAVVVMPETAPAVKVDGARSYGAEVIVEGTTSIERKARAEAEAIRRGLTMVPPFDDPDIIAGQGTVGREILEDAPTVDTVYAPIGGGGLIAGVAAAVKLRHPATRVVGVEPTGAAAMTASIRAGEPVTLDSVGSIADGLLPVRPGDLTFAHVHRFVDDVVTVEDDAIGQAVVWLARHAKLVVEPSGAATVAALLFGGSKRAGRARKNAPGPDRETIAVVSGGNVSLGSISTLVERYG